MGRPNRRTESTVQRPKCTLRYLSAKAPEHDQRIPGEPRTSLPSVVVDIGDASPEEARWWATVLAPGRGWQAVMSLGPVSFWSPWSIRVQSGPRFIIPHQPTLPPRPMLPASFPEALGYLNNFCLRHGISDQSHAALAAVLLLPTMRDLGKELRLPAVVIHNHPPPSASARFAQPHWPLFMCRHLDRLMAGGCYTTGIHPMLLSVFYNPDIECNAVAPWLQGTFAVIDSLAADKPMVLGRMLMDRQPDNAFLWLGATVLDLQKTLLEHVRLGWIPVDLNSAAWSGTLQSFIQQPVSTPLVVNGLISRADQCRLLLMSASSSHQSALTVPWKPFGGNPLRETDLGVQLHAQCEGHGLQYRGFQWDTDTGRVPVRTGGVGIVSPSPVLMQEVAVSTEIAVDYRDMRREHEFPSLIATRGIFAWLRRGGYTGGERVIWQHPWFDGTKPPERNKREVDEGYSDGESSVVLTPEEEDDEEIVLSPREDDLVGVWSPGEDGE